MREDMLCGYLGLDVTSFCDIELGCWWEVWISIMKVMEASWRQCDRYKHNVMLFYSNQTSNNITVLAICGKSMAQLFSICIVCDARSVWQK